MTPSLQIHTSNRLTVLLRQLLERLEAQPLAPFQQEVIVVQSQGMSRWLTLRLAAHQGIAMGQWMPFPSSLVERLAELLPTADGSDAVGEPLGEDAILWRLFALLDPVTPSTVNTQADDSRIGAPEANSATAAYLADDDEQVKRYQLASRLAQLFADYQLYRPDMLRDWQDAPAPEDPVERWQASLWRALTASPKNATAAPQPLIIQRMQRLQRWLDAPSTTVEVLQAQGFPPRLSVFGVGTLPPIFLQLLYRLATYIPVDLYFSSPTYHYWGDLRSPREMARFTRRLQLHGKSLDESHYETGNPLLAALGRQGRDFFNLLQEVDSDGSAWHELDFEDSPGNSVLAELTNDILHLVDPSQTTNDRDDRSRPLPLPPGDTSLSVHVCHSPMREMEVLRNVLLGLFADPENDGLRPEDVLVMVPDIDLYSPYIEAVFEVAHRDGLQLPVSIADRRAAHELPTAAAVLQLLDLVKGRLTPGDVFDFLECDAVLRRFGLRAADLPTLRQWVDALRIRWAMDGVQRHETFDVPAESANTWGSGIERLLLGYAAGPLDGLVAGVAPWSDEGPGDVELQGHFVALLDALFEQLRRLRAPRPLTGWSEDLTTCLERLFAPQGDDDERALQKVRSSLESLQRTQEQLAIDQDITLEAIAEHLRAQLSAESGVTQFLNGRITFCALKPMRSLPFEVICVAGLDDGSFPRRQPPRAFDLMQRQPRPGDRSLRDDDRYLFLETLMAARQRLILSYVGFSHKDGSPRAPSVVLSELLEHVDRTFKTDDGRPASHHLRVEHRLHAFHDDYFHADGPRSFSVDDLEACRALQQPRQQVPPFFPETPTVDGLAQQVPGTEQKQMPGTDLEGDPQVPGTEQKQVPGTDLEGDPQVPGTGQKQVPGTDLKGQKQVPGTEQKQVPGTDLKRQKQVPGTPRLDISLDDLLRFWAHPCRDYCRQILGLSLWDDRFETDGAEPFEIDNLTTYQLEQEMVQRRLAAGWTAQDGVSPEAKDALRRDERALLVARGDLPLAGLGDAAYASLRRDVDGFVDRLPRHGWVEPPRIDLTGDGWRLWGQLDGLTRNGLLRYRLARLKGSDQRKAWILHLVWQLARPQMADALRFIPLETRLLGRDGDLTMRPVAESEAKALLEVLIDGMRQGHQAPLPFFEGASLAFAKRQMEEADLRQGSRKTPMEAALDAWRGTGASSWGRPDASNMAGDHNDRYVALCFRSRQPLEQPEFAAWARRLWRPLLQATEDTP